MASFVRRFLFDPGIETLLEIESVNILDLEPPAQITGVGTGTVLVAGEFENGPFGQREVFGASDFKATFGTFGYEYDGVAGGNPSARERKADGALVAENWNGNGFISLANKRFRRLIVLRIDTSIGEVEFTRLACITGGTDPTFSLVTGQTLVVDPGTGAVVATFTGAVASVTSGIGAFPTLFTGGEAMNVTIDAGVAGKQVGPVDVVFTAGDQTQVDVINRINAVLGYTAAADAGGGTTSLTGRVGGTSGNVTINTIDAAVAAAVGFAAGATLGTGNVADIAAVTVAEVNTIVSTAVPTVSGDRDAQGRLRLCNASSAGTDLDITVASTAVGFGFAFPSVGDATSLAAGTIPAGTRVRNGAAVEFVTMQDIAVPAGTGTAGDEGPFTVKVRHAVDDTAGVSQIAAAVTVVPFPVALDGGVEVTNPLPLTAALTDAQIDAAYSTAIDATKALTKVGKEANVIYSARQSNTVRNALRQSALDASAQGAFGRTAVIRPPLGTTRAVATDTANAQPSVGAYRDQRVIYAFPGVQTFISQIAAVGATSGGSGFTDDGIVDAGFDGFIASILSQLPPEENPGQLTTFLTGVLGLEAGNADVQELTIGDYTNFKKNGIAAPRQSLNTGGFLVQSGVTSVNPATQPNLKNINRRRMADFIQDTLALRLTNFGKRLATRSRRAAIVGEIRSFLLGLQNDERIAAFSTNPANNAAELALGLFRIIVKVTTIPSLDSIVLETTIGESVQIDEAA